MKYLFLTILFMIPVANQGQALGFISEKGKIGYIDTSGSYAIPAQFKHARGFSQGYAGAEENKKWGFIDPSGAWVVTPRFERVKDFNSGWALVETDKKWMYINISGETLDAPEADKYYSFRDSIAFFKKDDKLGLFNTKGTIVTQPIYDEIKPFIDGYAQVRQGELWGMVDNKGGIYIPVKYDKIGFYSKIGVWADLNGTLGIVSNGNFVPVQNAKQLWDFKYDASLTPAKAKGKVGFVNAQGEWIIEPSFYAAKAFNKGLAPVSDGRKWGLVNEEGKLVRHYYFDEMEPFSDDGLAAVLVDRKWGFIDTSGNIRIPAAYFMYQVRPVEINAKKLNFGFNNGIARVKLKGKWGYLDTRGNLIGNKWFENAEGFSLTAK